MTTSFKGTKIRIFDLETGEKKVEYRRGFSIGDVTAVTASVVAVCACSQNTILFFMEGKHSTNSSNTPPLACMFREGMLYVVETGGLLSVFTVENDSMRIVSQHRLLTGVAEVRKKKRRTSI